MTITALVLSATAYELKYLLSDDDATDVDTLAITNIQMLQDMMILGLNQPGFTQAGVATVGSGDRSVATLANGQVLPALASSPLRAAWLRPMTQGGTVSSAFTGTTLGIGSAIFASQALARAGLLEGPSMDVAIALRSSASGANNAVPGYKVDTVISAGGDPTGSPSISISNAAPAGAGISTAILSIRLLHSEGR